MNKIIVANRKWVYITSDNGKTIYRRPFGKLGPKQLVLYKQVPGIICLN